MRSFLSQNALFFITVNEIKGNTMLVGGGAYFDRWEGIKSNTFEVVRSLFGGIADRSLSFVESSIDIAEMKLYWTRSPLEPHNTHEYTWQCIKDEVK